MGELVRELLQTPNSLTNSCTNSGIKSPEEVLWKVRFPWHIHNMVIK